MSVVTVWVIHGSLVNRLVCRSVQVHRGPLVSNVHRAVDFSYNYIVMIDGSSIDWLLMLILFNIVSVVAHRKVTWSETSLTHLSQFLHLLDLLGLIIVCSGVVNAVHLIETEAGSEEALDLRIVMIVMNRVN